MRILADLTQCEILALAISSQEDDSRTYADLGYDLKEHHAPLARFILDLADEDDRQRARLLEAFTGMFGPHLPLIRREDLRDWVKRPSNWDLRTLGSDAIRRQVQHMEQEAARFFRRAAERSTDPNIHKLFEEFAAAALLRCHQARHFVIPVMPPIQVKPGIPYRDFARDIVQPGLIRLMDGSIYTLAPMFAAAFATRTPRIAFLVGLASALGTGLTFGVGAILADDAPRSHRDAKLWRGLVGGLMASFGGIGHTLPYLLPDFLAATRLAIGIVIIELLTVAWVQNRYRAVPPFSASAKIMLAGALVLATGIFVGHV